MTTTTALIIVALIIVGAAAAWYILRQRRSKTLRTQFGPEYDRAVRQYGGETKAERALEARQKRLEKLNIHSLSPNERGRFAEQWHEVQRQFVDDPPGSIRQADELVCDVMQARGYPMADFERRAEDISVDHPRVVRNYRAAHAIALRHGRGEASTEDLRQALVYYRELFEELLEPQTAGARENRR